MILKIKHETYRTVLYLMWSRSLSKDDNIDNNLKMKIGDCSKQAHEKCLIQEKMGG